MSYLIDKLPPSWSAFSGDLGHKQCDLTLIQALKAIRIEDQYGQNFKPKSELKTKVNLVEDKPKRKFMNLKGVFCWKSISKKLIKIKEKITSKRTKNKKLQVELSSEISGKVCR